MDTNILCQNIKRVEINFNSFLFNIYHMKYLESFNLFKNKTSEKEDFKGKTQTYLYKDIHDKNGIRMGTCRECGKVVDITEHDPETCLSNYSESSNYANEELKYLLLNKVISPNFKQKLHNHANYFKDKIFPTVLAEQECNIKGLSQIYNIPFNLTETEFENLAIIFKHDEEVINFLFDELLKINPELEIFKNTSKKYDVINGATSRIDIEDYIQHSTNISKGITNFDLVYHFKRNDGKEKEYEYLYNTIKSQGVQLRWFPSINTMNFILRRIKKY